MRKRIIIMTILIFIINLILVSCHAVPQYLIENKQDILLTEEDCIISDTITIRDETITFDYIDEDYIINDTLNTYYVIPYEFDTQRVDEIVSVFWKEKENIYDEMMNPINYQGTINNINSHDSFAFYKSKNEALDFFLDSGSVTYINEEMGPIIISSENIGDDEQPLGCSITKEDAIDYANNIIESIKINDFILKEIIPYNQVESADSEKETVGFYMLTYEKCIDNTNILIDGLSSYKGQEVTISPDKLSILVNNNGVIQFKAKINSIDSIIEPNVILITSIQAVNTLREYLSQGKLVPPNTIDNIVFSNKPQYLYVPLEDNDLFSREYKVVPVWTSIISIKTEQGLIEYKLFY